MEVNKKVVRRKVIYDSIIFITVSLVMLVFKLFFKPYKRGFFCNDESLKYEYKDSTIPTYALLIYSVGIPVIIITFVEISKCVKNGLTHRVPISNSGLPIWAWNTYCALEIFLFGFIVQQAITDVAKYSVGRLRPHFYSVCEPDYKCTDSDHEYHVDYSCTSTKYNSVQLKDVRLSFPSGHASTSMYGMIYLMIYFQRNLHYRSTQFFKHFLQLIVVTVALGTGYSRIADHKHHWSDVLAGFCIGFVIAYAITKYIKNRFDYNHSSNINMNNIEAQQ